MAQKLQLLLIIFDPSILGISTINFALTFVGVIPRRVFGEKEWFAMRGKIAWAWSAQAFEAPRASVFRVRFWHVLVRTGVVWFWTALALERRALQVWREQRPTRAFATAP